MSVGRKPKNVKILNFSKGKQVRSAKEKQFQKAKKVPGALELAMERIADNLIEEVQLHFWFVLACPIFPAPAVPYRGYVSKP